MKRQRPLILLGAVGAPQYDPIRQREFLRDLGVLTLALLAGIAVLIVAGIEAQPVPMTERAEVIDAADAADADPCPVCDDYADDCPLRREEGR